MHEPVTSCKFDQMTPMVGVYVGREGVVEFLDEHDVVVRKVGGGEGRQSLLLVVKGGRFQDSTSEEAENAGALTAEHETDGGDQREVDCDSELDRDVHIEVVVRCGCKQREQRDREDEASEATERWEEAIGDTG